MRVTKLKKKKTAENIHTEQHISRVRAALSQGNCLITLQFNYELRAQQQHTRKKEEISERCGIWSTPWRGSERTREREETLA